MALIPTEAPAAACTPSASCTVLVAMFNDEGATAKRIRAMMPAECALTVYDKSTTGTQCSFMREDDGPFSARDECLPLSNVGKESHTWITSIFLALKVSND